MVVHWGSVAGAVAEACYVAGDVLLLGSRVDTEAYPVLRREDVDDKLGAMLPASSERLQAGALVGVLASPLLQLGAVDQFRGMGGRGSRTAALTLALSAGAHALAPFMHGSFFSWGEALRAAHESEQVGAGEEEVSAKVAAVRGIESTLEPVYAVYGVALLVSSVVMTERIARGHTEYPRWAALVVPPAWPMAASLALTATHVLPGPLKHGLQGAGYSLGGLVSFAASALLRRR